jgi:hypothetical protein
MAQARLLEFLEGAVAWLGRIPVGAVVGCLSAIGVAVGLYLTLKPFDAIELQKKFYAMINWRMEPISLPKEIRNTRLMGIFIIIFLLVAAYVTYASGLFQ